MGGWLICGRFTEYSPCPPLILKISCGVVVLLKAVRVLRSAEALKERSPSYRLYFLELWMFSLMGNAASLSQLYISHIDSARRGLTIMLV